MIDSSKEKKRIPFQNVSAEDGQTLNILDEEVKIIGLRVLNDNVIWLWVKDKSVVVVDPSVHEPVIRYIDENNFHLKAILPLSLINI